jgi:hypothetical protein
MSDRIFYDWVKIKKLYMSQKYPNIGAMCKENGWAKRYITKRITEKGWVKEKRAMIARAEARVDREVEEEKFEELKSVQIRHIKIGKLMQNRGVAFLSKVKEADCYKNAVLSAEAGTRVELRAYDKNTGGDTNVTILNQQNVVNSTVVEHAENIGGHCAEILDILDRAGAIKPKPEESGSPKT